MKTLLDIHTHGAGTFNAGKLKSVLKTVATRLVKYNGVGIVGITDFEGENSTDPRYDRLVTQEYRTAVNMGLGRYYPELRVAILHCQEVPTQQGHILFTGIKDKKLKAGRTLEETFKEAEDLHEGKLISTAVHPFYLFGAGDYLLEHQNLIKKLDSWEVHNGSAIGIPQLAPYESNQDAKDAYFRLQASENFPNLGALSSSDAHSLRALGTSAICLEVPDSFTPLNVGPDKYLEELKKYIQSHQDTSNDKMQTDYLDSLAHGLTMKSVPLLRKLGFKI